MKKGMILYQIFDKETESVGFILSLAPEDIIYNRWKSCYYEDHGDITVFCEELTQSGFKSELIFTNDIII